MGGEAGRGTDMIDPRTAIEQDGSLNPSWHLEAWPNAIGLDVVGPAGEWGVVIPQSIDSGTGIRTYRAFWVPAGESFPTLSGEGPTPQDAIRSARPLQA